MAVRRPIDRHSWGLAWGLAAVLLAALTGACASPSAQPGPREAAVSPTPTPKPPPPPASRVPDQPYVGTPRPVEQPYLEILRLAQSGQSNEELLAKVRRENVAYSLSTYDIQKLRAAGVSEEVIAAMLASGRESRTATPRSASAPATPVPASTPTPRGS